MDSLYNNKTINKMGKRDKDHKKRVAKRNEALKLQEKRMKKAQQDFIMNMIEKEKAAVKFNNNPQAPSVGDNGPFVDLGQGPQI